MEEVKVRSGELWEEDKALETLSSKHPLDTVY